MEFTIQPNRALEEGLEQITIVCFREEEEEERFTSCKLPKDIVMEKTRISSYDFGLLL